MRKFIQPRVALLVTGALVSGVRGFAAEDPDLVALREQVRQLDQQLKALSRQLEIKEEAAAEASKKTATVVADASGFALVSPDKSYRLNFRLLAQIDGRVFANHSTIPGTTTAISQNTILLRRIRPIIAGTVNGIFDFAVVPEFSAGDATTSSPLLQDAWIAAHLSPTFALKAGKFTSPVVLEPGSSRHFIESPFVNVLAPNRDIGLEFLGTLGSAFDYRLGVYNGARNNTASFARDGDKDKLLGGRLTFSPFKGGAHPLEALSFGLGGSAGRDKGAVGTALQNPVTNAQQTLLNFGPLSADGRHYRLSPSVALYTGSFSAVGEYIWEKQELRQGAVGFDAANTAWRATAGYVLTGEDATARGVAPRTDFRVGDGGWGAFEAAARVSSIRFDDDLFLSSRGSLPNTPANANATGATSYGAGLNWYLSRNLTVLLNYEHTTFAGRTARPDERAIFSRTQINF